MIPDRFFGCFATVVIDGDRTAAAPVAFVALPSSLRQVRVFGESGDRGRTSDGHIENS